VLALKAIPRPGPEGYDRQTKDKIESIVADARTAAKQRDGARVGTAVHDLTERVDRGELLADVIRPLPADTAQAVAGYEFLLRSNGWRVVEIERTVQCEELGNVTGSLDRIYDIPSLVSLGPAVCQHGHEHAELTDVIGDVKTEAKPWLNGIHIGPQLAIYGRSRKMWRATGGETTVTVSPGTQYERQVVVPNGEYVPTPCVRQDVGVVVHVHDGHAHPYFVKISAGWRAAQRAYEQYLDELDAKRDVGARGGWFSPMPRIVEPKPAELLTIVASVKDYVTTHGKIDEPVVEHPVGAVVTVSGVDFVKHSELPTLGEVSTVPAPATPVEPALMMIDGHVAGEPGDTLMQNGVTTHVAVRRDDGLVEWQPSTLSEQYPGENAGVKLATVDPVAPEPHIDGLDLPKLLIAQIWQATTVERLSELWQLAEKNAVPWRGPVEQAGAARRRQIECPQRQLHSGSGKCACGWQTGLAA